MQVDFTLSEQDVKRIASELAKQLAMPTLPPDRDAFSEAEAAERLGIAKHVLRDRRLRGEIAGKRIGRKWFYSPDDLRNYVSATR